jgi:cytoskeletal protein RodZ
MLNVNLTKDASNQPKKHFWSNWSGKTWAIVIGIVVVLGIIGMATGAGKTQNDTTNNTNSPDISNGATDNNTTAPTQSENGSSTDTTINTTPDVNTNTDTTTDNSTTTSPNTTTPNATTPDSSSNISGTCKDGTAAYGNPSAKGKANVCYGHGGWLQN